LEKRGKAHVKHDARIAKRKRMQDAVHASEEKFHVLLEASMDSVSVSVGTKFVYVNKRCAELLGFSDPSKLIGRDFTEFVAPEDRGMVKTRTLRRERGEPEPPLYEFKIQRRDGNKIPVETHATAIEYEGKRAVLSFRRDITERKRLEGALRLSERKFRQFVETAQEGVWSIDAEGKTMYANLKMAELLGYGVEQLLGKPLSAFMDDRGVKIAEKNLEQGRQDIKEQCEFEFIKKDGSRLYTSSSISPLIDDRGNHIGALALVSDITERKRREQEIRMFSHFLEEIASNLPDLVFIKDRNLKYAVVSEAACGFVGKSRQEILGKTAHDLYPRDFADNIEKTDREVFERGAVVEVPELSSSTKDGRTQVLHTRKAPLKDSQGNVTHVISITRDVTERKRMEDAIRSQSELLQKTFDSMTDAVFILDAKTPPRVLKCNEGSSIIFGYDRAEMLGKTTDLLHVNDKTLKEFQSLLFPAAEKGQLPFHLTEFHMKRKDGSIFPSEHSVMQLLNEKRERTGWVSFVRDITERKRAEEALKESQRSLEAVVETAGSLIVLCDPDGRITLFNHACEELTGYKREEVLGKTIPELFLPPKWVPVVQKRFADPYAPEVRAPHENPWVTKSGEERLVEWRCTVLPSPKDSRPCILGTGVDVTERKGGEKALKQSEMKLRALHRHARTLATDSTVEEVAKHTLDAMEHTLGVDVADFCTVEEGHIHVRGSRGIHVSPSDWPLDRSGVVARSAKTKRTLRISDTGKEPSFVDRRTFSATEGLQPMLSELAVPVLADDTVVAVLNVESNQLNAFTDKDQELLETLATHVASTLGRLRQVDALGGLVEQRTRELKESEERFRGLVERSFDMIVMLDMEGRISYASPAVTWVTGHTPQEMVQQHFRNYLPKDVIPKEIQAFAEIAKGGVARAVPLRIVRKDGSLIHIEVNASPIISDGKITGVQAIVRDVSERFKLTEMRDRFISSVTHELRTPLVSIKGYLDLALTQELGALPKEVESSLEVMKRNTDRLLSLTNEMLDIQRLESGRFQLNLTPMDLQEVVRHCVEEIRPSISEKQTFQIEVPDGPIPIQGDTVRLSQVLMNLLSNAVKFAPEGEITLCVKEMEDAVQVQVSDTGIGIGKEDLEHVFEPFASIQKPTYIKGTGLGLSVAKGLVEAHGGRIWADSQGEGKGANFTFTLAKIKDESVS